MHQCNALSTAATHRLVIFTDMDGTLLDPETYSWAEAEPALQQCQNRSIPVVLNSSKTRVEIEHFRQSIELNWPYIVENGGGIYFPSKNPLPDPEQSARNGYPGRIAIGISYARLCEALKQIATETKLPLKGFSQMSLDEIMALTGLKPHDAERAAAREFDEPFCLNDSTPNAMSRLQQAAMRLGLIITSGGRFYHLHGQFDKGTAVRFVVEQFRQTWGPVKTIALGDSDNDIPMLEAVDMPIWVAPGSHPAPWHIPNLMRSSLSGPGAWNHMVLSIINSW